MRLISLAEQVEIVFVDSVGEVARMRATESLVSRIEIARKLLQFFRNNKWWWRNPMIVVLLLLGIPMVFAESSAIAPFIYTVF